MIVFESFTQKIETIMLQEAGTSAVNEEAQEKTLSIVQLILDGGTGGQIIMGIFICPFGSFSLYLFREVDGN